MPIQGQTFTVTYKALNTSSDTSVAGDAANHTLYTITDGVRAQISNTITDQSNGKYSILLSSLQTACTSLSIEGISSTPNVILIDSGDYSFQPLISFAPTPTPTPSPAPLPSGTCPLEIDRVIEGATSATMLVLLGMPGGTIPTGATIPALMYGPTNSTFSYQFSDTTSPAPAYYVYQITTQGGPGFVPGIYTPCSATIPPNGNGPFTLTNSGGTGAGSAPMTIGGVAITTDQLQVLGGNGEYPISGCTINVYAAADITQSNLLATQTTGMDGRWSAGVNLYSGVWQVCFVVGGYQVSNQLVSVP